MRARTVVFKGEDRIAAKMDPRVREDDESGEVPHNVISRSRGGRFTAVILA
jgi:hypothetical protein